ncbi:MAG: nucleotide exchange factor GrpE [Brevinema sp.]
MSNNEQKPLDESLEKDKLSADTSEPVEENQQTNTEELDPMAVLQQENASLKDAYLRLSAETDNYRKRIQQEKDNFQKIALKGVIEKLLPVVDNLERSIQAAEHTEHLESLKEGVQMVLTQFETVLSDVGLEKISLNIGDEFDPQTAEALMLEESEDVEHSMTVVEIFETGRILNGQVIRTSKVKVAKKK